MSVVSRLQWWVAVGDNQVVAGGCCSGMGLAGRAGLGWRLVGVQERGSKPLIPKKKGYRC